MSRTTTLPPVESTPVLLIRFTEKADNDLITAVKERLEEEGLLIVETEYDANDGNSHTNANGMDVTTIIGITTTQARLEREAQVIRLMKRRLDTQIMEAFDLEQKHKYCDTMPSYRDEMGLFSSNDWSLLINRILEDTAVLPEGRLSSKLSELLDSLGVAYRPGHETPRQGEREKHLKEASRNKDRLKKEPLNKKLPKMLGGMRNSFRLAIPTQSLRHALAQSGFIDEVTPIHRTAIKDEIWRKTRNILRIHPPVNLMRQYYGEEIAFYFAWMGFLTQWLIFPGVIGLGAYGYRWWREDTIMTDEYTPFYGIITYIWSLLFLKFWKRHEARLSYQWGVMMGEYEKAKYFAVRPEYYGHVLRKSPVTGQLESYYPDWRRRCKYCVSALVTLVLLNAAFWTMIASLNMQGYINPKNDPARWGTESHHPFHWPRLSKLAEEGEIFDMKSNFRYLIPVVLHVATIFTFNQLYRIVATRLTKWENHQTQLSFNNSLILKRFLFEAFDCYVALFYLAFYERNIDKLRSELVSVFNIDTVRRLALECLVPMLLQKVTRKFKHSGSGEKKTDEAHIASRYTPLADQAELDEYEQFDDFMEIIIQFGYVTLFASAYPLASVISIVANLIEIRADAFKITYICQRPRSIRCDGLNMWNNLLKGIVRLSALTNCLIFGFTSGQLMEWLPSLYRIDETDHMRFRHDKGWIVIFIIFGLERILLWTGMLLDSVIPDVPEDVMNQLERRYFVLEEESREYEHQKELKRQGIGEDGKMFKRQKTN